MNRNTFLALFALTSSAFAGPVGTPNYVPADTTPVIEEPLFSPGLEVAAYALFLTPDASYEESWGGGVALDYYFNTNFALGASASWADVEANNGGGSSIGGLYSANATYRFPIGNFAPYVIGGTGLENFSADAQWVVHGGVGVQIACTSNIGIFADWIYNLNVSDAGDDSFQDFQTIRFGLRYAF